MGLIHRLMREFGKVKEHCPELWDLILEHKGVFTTHEDHVHFPRTDQLCHNCHNCDYCSQFLRDRMIQTLKVSESTEMNSSEMNPSEINVKDHCPDLWDLILENEGVLISHEDHVHLSVEQECINCFQCEYCARQFQEGTDLLTAYIDVPMEEVSPKVYESIEDKDETLEFEKSLKNNGQDFV